jgi:hypothetical protein
MYALRERRQHVTQEDFEFAVAKVFVVIGFLQRYVDVGSFLGAEKEPRGEHLGQQAFLIDCRISWLIVFYAFYPFFSFLFPYTPNLNLGVAGPQYVLINPLLPDWI